MQKQMWKTVLGSKNESDIARCSLCANHNKQTKLKPNKDPSQAQ